MTKPDRGRRKTIRRPGRKSLQLCKQISRALSYSFSDCGDDVVRELYVESVQPAPDDSRVLITVTPLSGDMEATKILTHLHAVTPRLRSDIAETINRKRVPELIFQCQMNPTEPEPT